jgi:hypothetical protein
MNIIEYNMLTQKKLHEVKGLKLLVTGYILSARKHGAAGLKKKGLGTLASIRNVEPSTSSVVVDLTSNTSVTINHFHYSEIELTMETRAQLAIFSSPKLAEPSGPSKLEYNLESCDKFFLKE